MSNLIQLVKGELLRLYKYKILIVGTGLSLVWVLIIGFSDKEMVTTLVPLLVFMDAAMMSIILLAASFYLEKQEGTLKTLLVTPVRLFDVLLAKLISSLVVGLISGIIVVGSALIFHQLEINLWLFFVYLIIVVASHCAIGFVLVLVSKDFTASIVNYALFALIAIIPSFLLSLGIIPIRFENIVLISPSYAGQLLFNSTVLKVEIVKIVIALIYLIALTITLFRFVIYKRFKNYVSEG